MNIVTQALKRFDSSVWQHLGLSTGILVGSLMLTACGSSDSASSESVSAEDGNSIAFLQGGEVLSDGALDSDLDGVVDAQDAAPLTPFALSDGETALSLSELSLWNESLWDDGPGEALAKDRAQSGGLVQGKIENLAFHAGPYLALWYSEQGISSVEIAPDSEGYFITEVPETAVTSVAVLAGNQASLPRKIQTFPASAAIVLEPQERPHLGETMELPVINIPALDYLSLGSQTLEFETLSATKIRTTLPPMSDSSVLVWESGGSRFSLPLNLNRRVQVVAGEDLVNAESWYRLDQAGRLNLGENLSPVQPAYVSVPVSEQAHIVSFYHDEFVSAKGIVWPDTELVTLGLESTLMAHLYERAIGENIQVLGDLETYMTDVLAGVNGQRALADLADLHAGLDSNQAYAVLSDWLDLAVLELNDYAPVQTQGVLDYFDDTFEAIFAGNTMYEPIMSVVDQRSRPGGSSYSGMNVGSYRNLLLCVGINNVNPPSGIWPSDLCTKNTGVYFASAQVTNLVTGKVLKSHVRDYLDTGMIGAKGWGLLSLNEIGYLTSDTGSPLCHMQPCEIEFITGGLGLGTNVRTNNSESRVQLIVLGRTFLERVVLPVLSEAMGGVADSASSGRCLIEHIVRSAPVATISYGTMIADFKKKVDAASNEQEVIATMQETVLKYAYEVATSMLQPGGLPKCLPAAIAKDLTENLSKRVVDFAEDVAVPLRYATIAVNAMRGFEAVNTPELFTFEVAPRASITSMTSSHSSSGIPELLSTNDSSRLDIRGTKFVYLQSDNSTYWPLLKLRDRYGKSVTKRLGESNKVDISDRSWVDIKVTVEELKPLMAQLRGDIVNVSLLMDDRDYSDFSNEGLPIPGRDVRWVGQPKITSVSPKIARAGRLVTIKGENLQSFNRADLKVQVSLASDPSQTADITTTVKYLSGSEIQFRLPSNTPDNVYDVALKTSDPDVALSFDRGASLSGLSGAFVVIPNGASTIQLYDSGARSDDLISVTVTDAAGNTIRQNGEPLSLEIEAGDNLRARWMYWTNTNLSASDGGSTTPGGIEISCVDPNTDRICTWRVRGEVNVDGNFVSLNRRGKLEDFDATLETF